METFTVSQNVTLNTSIEIGTANFSSENDSDLERDEALARAEVATLAIMFLVTVMGNIAVLLALSARPRKKLSRMYYFILHLSIADLCTAFLSVLPQFAWDVTYRFYGGPLLCKVVKYGQTLGPYLSAYILMATALDRYQAVCHPLAYCSWTSRRSRAMVWTAWVFALGFCVPQVVVFSYQEVGPGVYDCWATFIKPWGERTYVTWYSVSVFIVPFCVLAATYSSICREIWLHAGRSPQGQQGNCSPLISRAKMNTVKQMVAVLALYVACSAPFICAQLWATWDPHAHTRPFFTGAAFTILTLLSSLNSCVNPWIYLAFNRELVRLLRQQLICRGRETSGYCAGSGGSASSTGTPGDTGPCKRKSFPKLANSVIVTKTSFTEINSPRRVESEGSCSPAVSVREGTVHGTRSMSFLSSSLFVRNDTFSSTATCCGASSGTKDLHGSSARKHSKSSKGLTRSGAIRKKSKIDENIISRANESVETNKSKKCFAYSPLGKKYKKKLNARMDVNTDEQFCSSRTEEEPAVSLLEDDSESGKQNHQLQVNF